MARILGLLKLWEMPWGGAITLAMRPIFLFAVRWGPRCGLLGAFVFGWLQLIYDGGFAISWQSLLGDYILAFTTLGLAGFFRGKRGGVFWGALVGGGARFLIRFVVGATVSAMYMPDEFFGQTMTSPWVYSFLYNGFYMFVDIALCLVVFALMYWPLRKYLTGEDIRPNRKA